MNVVLVSGVITRSPASVRLADGTEVLSLSLLVASADRAAAPRDAVPVVVEDPSAAARALGEGDEVCVRGRVRRRFFRAGGRVASPTEVVAESVVLVRHRGRVRRQLRAAVDELAAAVGDPS